VSGPVVAIVLCDPCGNREIGHATREPAEFHDGALDLPARINYTALDVPGLATEDGRRVTGQRYWTLDESPPPLDDDRDRVPVECRRCRGIRHFSAAALLAEVRRRPAGAPPVKIRARVALR